MKAWNRIILSAFVIMLLLTIGVNVFILQSRNESIANDKIVDINRMVNELNNGRTIAQLEHQGIQVDIVMRKDLKLTKYMDASKQRVVVLPGKSNDEFYRFSYQIDRIPSYIIGVVNTILIIAMLLVLYLAIFIHRQIIKPFHQMEAAAEAISNRDFTYQLPQHRFKFFGKFIWAIDVMKEELRYHEQKELELMREKKVMIASISHDIKTPLSNIRLYTDAMKDKLYPVETTIQRIDENCDKIDQYVKDIISTSNQELFDFKMRLEEVFLHDILPILEQEQERITLAMIRYSQELYDTDYLIYADLSRLKEVIDNLIDNAMKYGNREWIHVSFYEEDHHPILKITNSGNCIHKQDAKAVFQSFYRGNNVGEQKGNGLGLYICKELMVKMKGDIFMTQEEHAVSFHLVLETL